MTNAKAGWSVVFLISAILVLILVYISLPDDPGPTKNNFYLIKKGMTLEEVSLLMGVPGQGADGGVEWPRIRVVFDDKGKLQEKTYDGVDLEPGLLPQFRQWFCKNR
jgi:hypothetical protein